MDVELVCLVKELSALVVALDMHITIPERSVIRSTTDNADLTLPRTFQCPSLASSSTVHLALPPLECPLFKTTVCFLSIDLRVQDILGGNNLGVFDHTARIHAALRLETCLFFLLISWQARLTASSYTGIGDTHCTSYSHFRCLIENVHRPIGGDRNVGQTISKDVLFRDTFPHMLVAWPKSGDIKR
ncbi:hypothetical protein BJV74DRAFT_270453 [Russula compacta]|nr:hypothetical protein BJV74DRAFT_270453 [Russula compacta]